MKLLKKAGLLVTAAIILILAVIGGCNVVEYFAFRAVLDDTASSSQKTPPTASQPVPMIQDIQSLGKELLDKLPDGGAVEQKDFVKNFGADTANLMKQVGMNRVERSGNHLTAYLDKEVTLKIGSLDVKLKRVVEFDATASNDTLDCTNVGGVQVSLKATPWMDLKDIRVRTDGGGNTIVTAKVKLWFKKITYTLTFDPDGNQIS